MALNLIDMKETAALTGRNHILIRRMVKEGRFPVPVLLPIPHPKRPKLYFHKGEVAAWIKACVIKQGLTGRKWVAKKRASRGRGGMGTGPDGDAKNQRETMTLQEQVGALQTDVDALITANLGREALITDGRERADRIDAAIVKLTAQVDVLDLLVAALEDRPAQSVALPVDPDMPSKSERDAMVARLRTGTLRGIELNALNRDRAGGPITREPGGVAS